MHTVHSPAGALSTGPSAAAAPPPTRADQTPMPLQHPAPALLHAAPHRRPGAPAVRALRAALAWLGCSGALVLGNPVQAEPAPAPTVHGAPAANAQAALPAAHAQAGALTANTQATALSNEPDDLPPQAAATAADPLSTATATPPAGAAAPASNAVASAAKPGSLSDKGLQVKALAQGVVSYYANFFSGRSTANGERFDQRALTMAHRSLPFGTLVRVVCLRTERSVVVRVNDRGPFVGNRVADLSRAAAEQLNMISAGLTQARLEVLGPPASVKASAKGLAQALPPAVAAARR